MKSLNFDTNDGVFEGEIMLYVYDKRHLEKLIKKLKNINGIEKSGKNRIMSKYCTIFIIKKC